MEQTDMGTSAHASLKEKQRQERRTLILQMAEEILMEKGYYETSIDEIASRVGIAKSTVYLHFPSKEDLVIAILKRDLQHLLAKIDEVTRTDATVHDKVEAILYYAYGTIFIKRMQLLSSLYMSGDAKRHQEKYGDTLKDLAEQLATTLSALLEQGKTAGEFDTSIPTPIMLSAFFGLLSPRSYKHLMAYEQIGQMERDELVSHLGRLYFKGIARL
ncbi:MAG: TetR/AcrR family transcriptional regulator [Ktedonobacteraceae bacterium]